MDDRNSQSSFTVLGVRIDAVQIPDVISQMEGWIQGQTHGHYIIAVNTHVIIEGRRVPAVGRALEDADLRMPDGMPLVLLGQRNGFPLRERARGPDLMSAFLEHSASRGYSHFFYGGTQRTLDSLVAVIRSRWSGVRIAGAYSPPDRPLGCQEKPEILDVINEAAPDVLWVGLGCPKQELWMFAHRDQVRVPVMVGVGQAFDILSGCKRDTPMWMQQRGLEWVWRLANEPRRIWKRVFVYAPLFFMRVVIEELIWRRPSRGNGKQPD